MGVEVAVEVHQDLVHGTGHRWGRGACGGCGRGGHARADSLVDSRLEVATDARAPDVGIVGEREEMRIRVGDDVGALKGELNCIKSQLTTLAPRDLRNRPTAAVPENASNARTGWIRLRSSNSPMKGRSLVLLPM